MSKRTFLVCCDYGTGGIWFLVDAESKKQIDALHPEFCAFETKPDWMSEGDKTKYFLMAEKAGHHWDVDNKEWLKKFK
ncbi:hypothetical protein [Arsukibacterium indicum]|uniref:Uncharacterized protein n=1 Tax=Arsukibacterium indicum TaxID=2848612 RepID=A0ABS6MQS2_9GAMM|nr:hypothetical protein [Arsukibacterium indicum]MBV2131169.1 hypothetical protein [Arsukibacterium indicum]